MATAMPLGQQWSCQSARPCRPDHMRFYYSMLASWWGASGAARVPGFVGQITMWFHFVRIVHCGWSGLPASQSSTWCAAHWSGLGNEREVTNWSIVATTYCNNAAIMCWNVSQLTAHISSKTYRTTIITKVMGNCCYYLKTSICQY